MEQALDGVIVLEDAADDQSPDTDFSSTQADLEDQTLPAPLATLPLDWHPFPHLYPHVNGGASVFIDPLRPPPLNLG